jgi:hypothetical protein
MQRHNLRKDIWHYHSCFFYSCNQDEKDVAGVYVKSPLVNTIDSLYFYAGGLLPTKAQNRKVYNYIQRFYTKRTGNSFLKINLHDGLTKMED